MNKGHHAPGSVPSNCLGRTAASDRPPPYRSTVDQHPRRCTHSSPLSFAGPRANGPASVEQPHNYGSVPSSSPTSATIAPRAVAYSATPSELLPLHFTMRHMPDGGIWRAVVVSAIMCALIAGTDHRLFNGIVYEYVDWAALCFLTGARAVLLDLVWSAVIATVLAFIWPVNIIAFLIAVDWLIPGRPISFLLENGQGPVSILFYVSVLVMLGLLPPLLPLRWTIDWALGYFPRVERRSL